VGATLTMKPEGAAETLRAAKDLIEVSLEAIEPVKRYLALLVARVEAEALVGRAEAAYARQARTVPVVRGYRGWSELGTQKGLLARFYRGTSLSGEPVCRRVGIPDLTNYSVPGIGKERWSVRYTGEIHVPSADTYKFVCTGDDGVRLNVAGQGLLDKSAWRDQPATSYGGTIRLTAGWHPIELMMYQGGGESKLSLQMGKGRKGLRPVKMNQFRCSAEGDNEKELAAQMASLPKGVVRAADGRLRHDFGVLADVPGAVARMADDVGSKRLESLAREQNGAAQTVRSAVASTEQSGWSVQALDAANSRLLPLVWAARQARSILQDELSQLRGRLGIEPGVAGQFRRSLDRALAHADRIDNRNSNLSKEEQDAQRQRHDTALRAELDQMKRTLVNAKTQLLAEASRNGATVGERRALLGQRRRLEDDVERALDDAVASVPASAEETAAKREAVSAAINAVVERLGPVAGDASRAAAGRQASVASLALRSSEALARLRSRGDAIGEMGAYRALSSRVQELADLAREDNRFDTALALEEELGESPAEVRRETLERLMEDLVETDRRNALRAPLEVAERLEGEVERLREGEPGAVDEAVERLGESPLALAVAGEQFRMKGEFEEAIVRDVLSRDLAGVLGDSATLTADRLATLARRAKAIEGELGATARDESLREAAERYASRDRHEEARRLEDLARKAAEAASGEAQRDEFAVELRQVAKPALQESTEAAFAKSRADALAQLAREAMRSSAELEQLRAEATQARMDAARARREFAELEESIADALDLLKHSASRESAAATSAELRQSLEIASKRLPEEARKIVELAQRAGAGATNRADAAPQVVRETTGDPDEIAAQAGRARAAAERAAELAEIAMEEADRVADLHLQREADARRKQEQARGGLRTQAESLLGKAVELTERQATRADELSIMQDGILSAMDASERAAAEEARQSGFAELATAAAIASKRIEDLAAQRADGEGAEPDAGWGVAEAVDRMQQIARNAADLAERERARLDKLAEAMADSEGAHAKDSLALVADERAAANELARLADAAEQIVSMVNGLAGDDKGKANDIGLAEAEALAGAADRFARKVDLAARAAEKAKLDLLEVSAVAAEKAANDASQLARTLAVERGDAAGEAGGGELADAAEEFAKAALSRLDQGRRTATEHERGNDFAERARDLAERSVQMAKTARRAADQATDLAAEAERSIVASGPHELAATREHDRDRALGEGARKLAEAEALAESARVLAERAMKLAELASSGDRPDVEAELDFGALAAEAASAQQTADRAQLTANQAHMQAAEAQQQAAQQAAAALGSAGSAIAERSAQRALDRANMAQQMAEAEQERANEAHRALMEVMEGAAADEAFHVARQAADAIGKAERNAVRGLRNAREGKTLASEMRSESAGEVAQGNVLKAESLEAEARDLKGRAAQLRRFRSDESARTFDETNAQLSQMAGEQARSMRQRIALPIAEAYRASGSASPNSRVGRLGREIAELVAEQQRAAELLERSLAKQDALRQEFAESLSAGEETALRLGRSTSGLVSSGAKESDRQARAEQESANRLQQSADFAQERADRAQQAANESLARAAQARYAVEQLRGNPKERKKRASEAEHAAKAAQAAQQHALFAQAEALALQQQASAATPAPWSPQSTALSEQAISNLRRAQNNALQAMQNSATVAAALAPSEEQAGPQAGEQVQRARMAMIRASDGQDQAAADLAERLSNLGNKAQLASDVQNAAAQIAGAPSLSPPALARAAAEALSTVQSGSDQAQSYVDAAQLLTEAASQARLASASRNRASTAGSQQGQGQSQAEGQRQQSQQSGSGGGAGQQEPTGDTGVEFAAAGAASEDATWARLPERVRSAIRSGGIERFSEEHREAIRAYFRRLGEEQ
jgi:hypothetical protein